jgi:peroxiredoxin family protein
MAGNINVSSLIPSDINNTLSQITNPKAFGDQIINSSVTKLKTSSLGKIEVLKNDIQVIVKKILDLEVKHAKTLVELNLKFNPPKPIKPSLTPEEYTQSVANENKSYTEEKTLLQQEKLLLQQKLQDILNDPYKKIKDSTSRLKKKITSFKQQIGNKKNKEKKRLSLKVLKNAGKSLTPIIALQGTKLLFEIVNNNKKLQDLVDNTNAVIDAAVTQQDINNARVLRNSTLSILNDNERKLASFAKIISNLNKIVFILGIILRLSKKILPIPTPSPSADFVTPPKERFRFKYETAVKLVDGLNVLIAIFQGILDAQLSDLNDLKNQLQNINDLLDNAALNNLSDSELQDLINNLQNQVSSINSTTFPEYKGFKFAIKEEETLGAQQAIVVRGTIKRRYAVAIDRDGVEVLKSEFSFTLDPPDLVEQLKLIIDQQNLQG